MSSSVAIAVENLGKCYTIRHQAAHGVGRYKSFREVLANAATAPFRNIVSHFSAPRSSASHAGPPSSSASSESFWALRDVSFEIKQGEAVGIIGRNGAGKSTLLKLLSRITEPTTGEIGFNGRVASLLEVGTGFHPELTGRENIFLNGAIMGMSRVEIKSKFDEIVAFAEVERFLDTPVKRYSSGMYVRLAFSVAAHLEPEILIVDEVLAVGDSQFQKKCIEKMDSVSSEGRTVLFVSHNMAVVNKLCTRAILLSEGKVSKTGQTAAVVEAYLGAGIASESKVSIRQKDHVTSWGSSSWDGSSIQLLKVSLINAEFGAFQVRWQQPVKLEMEFEVKIKLQSVIFSLGFTSVSGVEIFGSHSNHDVPFSLNPGTYRIQAEVHNPLRAGLYYITFGADYALGSAWLLYVPRAVTLEVLDVSIDGREHPQWGYNLIDVHSEWSAPCPTRCA